ncbi:hypothetical protein [Bacillus mobilis]
MTDPMIPFNVEVVDLPDTLTSSSLAVHHDEMTWYLQKGTPTPRTATDAARDLPDEALAMLLLGFGRTCDLDYARRDPIGALGPLVTLLADPDIIPACLARHRA